jgi:hypothetical protein
MFAKWLRSLAKWPRPGHGSLRKGWRSALFFQPSFEQLEDRLVPTTLSIPTTLIATQGGVVAVPIMVDSLKDAAHGNTGLSGGNFVIFYNPAVFSVTTSDVGLGTIVANNSTAPGNGYSPSAPNGWNVTANANTAGILDVGLSTGSNGTIVVSGVFTHFTVSAPTNVTAGMPFLFTVQPWQRRAAQPSPPPTATYQV